MEGNEDPVDLRLLLGDSSPFAGGLGLGRGLGLLGLFLNLAAGCLLGLGLEGDDFGLNPLGSRFGVVEHRQVVGVLLLRQDG